MLHWNVLMWNFGVEQAILGHNVKDRNGMPKLPILVLLCSKRPPAEGGTPMTIKICLFEGGGKNG